jgi:hypothetical protein
MSPLFYLTVFLVGGSTFLADIAMEYFRYEYFKNASDFVRGLISYLRSIGYVSPLLKLDLDEKEMLHASGLYDFMVPIEFKHKISEFSREKSI